MKIPPAFLDRIPPSIHKLLGYAKETPYIFSPSADNIEVLNFWPCQKVEDLWLYQFVKLRCGHLLSKETTLLIASLFGPSNHIRSSPAAIKIFFQEKM